MTVFGFRFSVTDKNHPENGKRKTEKLSVPSLSVTIIAMNQEANIGDCLQSVSSADEIVVVDSGSADRTVELARDGYITGQTINVNGGWYMS